MLFAAHEGLGGTLPTGGVGILMFTILAVTTGALEKDITAGLAIGGVVTLAAIFGGRSAARR